MLCVAALVVIGAVVGGLMFIDNMVKNRTTYHTFEVDGAPCFLNEKMAITFARKSLTIEGFDVTAWELQEPEYNRTADPDGHNDKYSVRNSPNSVSIIYVNKSERKTRCVDVELEGKLVICAVTIPK